MRILGVLKACEKSSRGRRVGKSTIWGLFSKPVPSDTRKSVFFGVSFFFENEGIGLLFGERTLVQYF